MFRKFLLMAAIVFTAGLLFVNIYNSMVDAPNWGGDIPASIQTSREYFNYSNPGVFFRLFSPANQIITFLAVIFCWNGDSRVRYFLVAALLIAVTADVLTFGYFYPRNAVMFTGPVEGNIDAIKSAWAQWSAMNWVRSGLVTVGLVFDFAALTRLSTIRTANDHV